MPDHGGHDMPGMGGTCVVSMLWNTNVMDTCIVFPGWHITSKSFFVFSFFIVVALGIFYEYLRIFSRQFDYNLAQTLKNNDKSKGLLPGDRHSKQVVIGTRVPLVPRVLRAGLYGATVFLSFFLMLIFMTYNAYLILAVVLGAAIGHFVFSSTLNTDAILCDSSSGKGMACH
ncbi:hypothetical protein Agabi119p4_1514 [Agaricus bisporus var. burnettii]|uniref:Copper transport protein n=1 Tax=Agaricus bisporus var. burnettii TaxID=192524 RepID=A0A8H7F7I5_AGABI|nr:hypothetical protein Agabi119p4_1514 [Agaricus bisporus var. burnettii]